MYLNLLLLLYYFFFFLLPVERQIAAIRAMRDVEIEQLLTDLRLLRSYFKKEQLQTPVWKIFRENLPNLSVLRKEENKQIEVQWNSKHQNISMNDGREIQASLLHRLSTAYCNYSGAIPSLGGFEFSSKAGIRNSGFVMHKTEIKSHACIVSYTK